MMQHWQKGPTFDDIASHLGADRLSVRSALLEMANNGHVTLLRHRRGGALHAFPKEWDHGIFRVCPSCSIAFVSETQRKTCSRSCAVSLSWKNPSAAEKRISSIKAQKMSEESRLLSVAVNKKRWSRPGEREKLSRRSKEMWSDPVTRAELSAKIYIAQSTPEMRALYSKIRKDQWNDPQKRELMVRRIRETKGTPEARAKFSKLLKDRWDDPEGRKIYLAGVRKTARKMSERNKGRKQNQDHVEKRVASRKKNTMEQG